MRPCCAHQWPASGETGQLRALRSSIGRNCSNNWAKPWVARRPWWHKSAGSGTWSRPVRVAATPRKHEGTQPRRTVRASRHSRRRSVAWATTTTLATPGVRASSRRRNRRQTEGGQPATQPQYAASAEPTADNPFTPTLKPCWGHELWLISAVT